MVTAMIDRIDLPRSLAIALLRQAQGSPDREVCGMIAKRGQHLRVIPIRNAATDSRRLFDMDERELIDAMKVMRERGEGLFAIYHSHPDSAPEPSTTDIERAGYPDVLHLIISLATKGVLQMRGWRLDDSVPRAIEVGVSDESPG